MPINKQNVFLNTGLSNVLPVGHEARAPTQTPAREVGLQDMAMGADELRQQLKYLDAKNVTFEFDTAATASVNFLPDCAGIFDSDDARALRPL